MVQYWIKNRGSSADSIFIHYWISTRGVLLWSWTRVSITPESWEGFNYLKNTSKTWTSRIEGPSLKASKFYLYFSSTWIPLYLQLSDVAQRRQSELLSPLRSWVQFLLLYDSCHLCDKNQSTLCQKSWVFSGCSGFLPQGKLTGCVRINTVRKLISQLL